jgi:glycosyltransferase involved in cell wall biosynthesis
VIHGAGSAGARETSRRVMLYAGASVPGGLLAHVALLARGLAARDHAVHAVLHPAPGAGAAARACEEAGAQVTRLTVSGRTDLRGMMALRHLVARAAPHIFHAHLSSPGEALPALAAARWGGAGRVVTTEHAPGWFPLERFYSRTAKRAAARALHAVIAVCEADARLLREGFGLPAGLVRVIPNGVEPIEDPPPRSSARAALGVPPDAFVVGCAAALEIKKGVLDLLEAVRRMGRPGAVLALAGEGSQRAALESRAAQAGVALVMPGHVGDMAAFLATLDLYALASHQEAMPLSLLQAMMAGLPIVATRVGGVPEALEDTGVLVEPSDPESLASALSSLATDAARAAELAARARLRARARFTAALMAERVAELYDALLAAGRERAGAAR